MIADAEAGPALPAKATISTQAATANGASPAADRNIYVDVSVRSASGQPVPELTKQDLTLLDNGHAQELSSFRAMPAGQGPGEIIFLMDAANVRYINLSRQQQELQNYLRSAGKLPHPATIAVLTDDGVRIQKGFSRDGTELSKVLDSSVAGLRTIRRSAGFWGATERLQLSLKAMDQLAAYAKTLPGRKFLVWISPGWPLLSGPQTELDRKNQRQIFQEIVGLSSDLRAARVTMYDVNPFGLNQPLIDSHYYLTFVKGVRKAEDTEFGNLGLQVLAVQSGGKTITTDNDIEGGLRECVRDTESWYEVSFPMAQAEKADEYHHLEVKVAGIGGSSRVIARTRDGYYAQPAP
ncbi:MAG TPA: VWA domain-containing protein [Acidobacteriaceae bacterium]|nr:VWA domain-containing protein [Acidobacteriaceae bacterium]